jgi:hypothetical protein
MSQAWSDCTAGLPKESSGETTWTTVGDPETAPLTANMSPFISPLPVDTTLNASNHQSVQAAMEAADDTSIIALPESPNSMVENLLREKNSRGKGRHYCPYRLECTKGGVSADKSLVLFERNSAFKYVTHAMTFHGGYLIVLAERIYKSIENITSVIFPAVQTSPDFRV